jgi:hypothetical protein
MAWYVVVCVILVCWKRRKSMNSVQESKLVFRKTSAYMLHVIRPLWTKEDWAVWFPTGARDFSPQRQDQLGAHPIACPNGHQGLFLGGKQVLGVGWQLTVSNAMVKNAWRYGPTSPPWDAHPEFFIGWGGWLRIYIMYVWFSKLCYKNYVVNVTNITFFAIVFIYI